MATIYYRKEKKTKNRWRVMFKHKGLKPISKCFYTKKEAVEFLKKTEKSVKEKIKDRNLLKKIDMLF